MRWDALFNDLEAQIAEGERLSIETEISERARAENGAVALADRLRGSVNGQVVVSLTCGRTFEGVLSHAGAEALVLNEGRHQVLIPYAAVARYAGLGRLSVTESSQVRRRIGLSSALRGLARNRTELAVTLRHAPPDRGNALTGVIDRVGSDFFDLAIVNPGEARRASQVRQVATIPFAALSAVRSWNAGEM